MSFPFMDIDEYRRKYPDLAGSKGSETSAPVVEEDADDFFNMKKTPIQIVQEVSTKGFHQIGNVDFKEEEHVIAHAGITTFSCHAHLMKFEGKGEGRTKKMAKQKACYELIKCAILMDRYSDFKIPAKSREDALQILEQLKPEEEEQEQLNALGSQTSNWVGKLDEFCIQNKLGKTEYAYSENGAPNEKVFTVHVSVGQHKVSAEAGKKKNAKTLAAQKLLLLLKTEVEKLKEATKAVEEVGEQKEEEEDLPSILAEAGVDVSRAQSEPYPQKVLEELLADESRFVKGSIISYRDISHPTTLGRTQTLLTVQFSRAPPQPFSNADGSITTPKIDKDAAPSHCYVFGGESERDEQQARDEAARAALTHLYTYKGFS